MDILITGAGASNIVFWHSVLPTRWWDSLMRVLGSPWLARFAAQL